jgi:hypothetical protein
MMGQLIHLQNNDLLEGTHVLPIDFQTYNGVYHIELIDTSNQHHSWVHIVNQ